MTINLSLQGCNKKKEDKLLWQSIVGCFLVNCSVDNNIFSTPFKVVFNFFYSISFLCYLITYAYLMLKAKFTLQKYLILINKNIFINLFNKKLKDSIING
jgi:hypothetical protein